MGKVDFGGLQRETCLAYVPEAVVGDYTVVHVGFALHLIDEVEAQETLALLKEIGEFEEDLTVGDEQDLRANMPGAPAGAPG